MKRSYKSALMVAATLSLWNCSKTSDKTANGPVATPETVAAQKVLKQDAISVADLDAFRSYMKGSWTSDSCNNVANATEKSKSERIIIMTFADTETSFTAASSLHRFTKTDCQGSSIATYAIPAAPLSIKNVSTSAVKLSEDLNGFEAFVVHFGATTQSKDSYALVAFPGYDSGLRIFLMSKQVDKIEKLPLSLSYESMLRFDGK